MAAEVAAEDGDEPEQSLLRVCIVEVGCGTRIATCRILSESFVEDLLEKNKNCNAELIRINPNEPGTYNAAVAPHTIPIMSNGLEAIRRIDEEIKLLEEEEEKANEMR